MALTLPQLDDRRFSDLIAELRSLIPQYDRDWTNHNASDPGITLLELFAWLAEMVIYRLNRIEDRTYRTFLELIGLQPAAPRATMTFELDVPKASLAEGFCIPQGIRIAALDTDTQQEIVFETLSQVPLSLGRWDADRSIWVFRAPATNTIRITDEFIGFGTGKKNQELLLKSTPVFLDRENESYEGNPQIHVGDPSGPAWKYRRDLLESGAEAHFTVGQLAHIVRFGDGIHGEIPPEKARISCSYRKLGNSRGNVKANSITTLKDPIPGIADQSLVKVFNEYPAEGGTDGETLDTLLTRGLCLMSERSRAVSQDDFESLAKAAAPGRVSRVLAVFDRNLENAGNPDAPGHVSVIVLPAIDYLWPEESGNAGSDALLPRRSCSDFSAALNGPKTGVMHLDILEFLNQRRLITTIIHVVSPIVTSVAIDLTVYARQGVNTTELEQTIQRKISRFFDPYIGWVDEKGWPFGRKVYRSELYQQIEAIEGVDHTGTLLINGDSSGFAVNVGEFDLVGIDTLKITVNL